MSDEAILHDLLSGKQSDVAWRAFLDQYSNHFLKVISRFEKDHDQAMETYLYVCEKFAANDFAILRKFQHDYKKNPPKFSTWLFAVTRNMCIDAYRAAQGRRQMPRTIQRLEKLDRLVFTLYYWKGLSREEVENAVINRENVSSASIQESFEKVIEHAELLPEVSRRQDWKPTIVPFHEELGQTGSTQPSMEEKELLTWLEHRLAELPKQEKLVVRLYFWEEMTGAEIAKALRITPQQQVYYTLRKALARLRNGAGNQDF